jgi:phosphomannomutase
MGTLLKAMENIPKNKKLIVFDLDGTLTKSKSDMDSEMAELLKKLLEKKLVAVIGGGKYEIFQNQFLAKLDAYSETLKNLFIFPTTATVFYKYNGQDWEEVYKQIFTSEEKEEILAAFEKTFHELDYKHPEKTYGELIEDRGGEIAFSALGQEAPLEAKEKWNKGNPDIRAKMEEILQKYLPDMEVKVTGLTSIDITRKGVDKSYGIRQIEKYLNVPIKDMLFVGDAFFREGNDEAALQTGVLCFEVKGVEDTKNLIRYLLLE